MLRELLERIGGLDQGAPVGCTDMDRCPRREHLTCRQMLLSWEVLVHNERQSRDALDGVTALQALQRVHKRWGLPLDRLTHGSRLKRAELRRLEAFRE